MKKIAYCALICIGLSCSSAPNEETMEWKEYPNFSCIDFFTNKFCGKPPLQHEGIGNVGIDDNRYAFIFGFFNTQWHYSKVLCDNAKTIMEIEIGDMYPDFFEKVGPLELSGVGMTFKEYDKAFFEHSFPDDFPEPAAYPGEWELVDTITDFGKYTYKFADLPIPTYYVRMTLRAPNQGILNPAERYFAELREFKIRSYCRLTDDVTRDMFE